MNSSPYDDSAKLFEQIEEMARSINYLVLDQIRQDLFNSGQRLAAEISWLPGLAPEKQNHIIGLLKTDPDSCLVNDELSPLARANLLASVLAQAKERLPDYCLILFRSCNEIKPDELLKTINETREKSGWPQVVLSQIQDNLNERRDYFLAAVRNQLAKLKPAQKLEFLTLLTKKSTQSGTQPPPSLLTALLESYEQEVKNTLHLKAQTVFDEVLRLHSRIDFPPPDDFRDNAPGKTDINLEGLSSSLKDWDRLAQPFQLLTKSLGANHHQSQTVALKIRELAFSAYNTRGFLALAQDLTDLMREVFAEVVDVAEQAEKDKLLLDRLAQEKEVREITEQAREMSDYLNQLLSVVLFKTREISSKLDKKMPVAEIGPHIDELGGLLKAVTTADKLNPAVQKVALLVRNLALSLYNRYGLTKYASSLLASLGRIFEHAEPYASLFSSDLTSISRSLSGSSPQNGQPRKSLKYIVIFLILLALVIFFLAFLKPARSAELSDCGTEQGNFAAFLTRS